MPALEIYEKEDRFVVRAEVPGMTKDDVDISILGDTLPKAAEAKPKKIEVNVKETQAKAKAK